jgi:hypothetical protein
MPEMFSVFGNNRTEVIGNLSTYGTTMTANASANTKGAWAELSAATPFDVHGIYLSMHPSISDFSSHLVDIGVGAEGSEVVLVSNIAEQQVAVYLGNPMIIPIRIAAGQRISMRTQSNTGGAIIRATITLLSQSMLSGACESRSTTYGSITASSAATSVDPGGTADTRVFTQLSAATTNPIHKLIIDLTGLYNASRTTCLWMITVAVGAAGSEVVILPEMYVGTGNVGDHIVPSTFGPFDVNIPVGSRLSVGLQCTITEATDRLLGVEIIGLG